MARSRRYHQFVDTFRAVALYLLTVPSWAASPSDRAIAALLPLPIEVLSRSSVDADLDFVAALASPKGQSSWWAPNTKLGLFLQSRADPDKVFRLGILDGHADGECHARAVRVTSREFVLSCAAEKGNAVIHEKFLYDISAKSLRGTIRSERIRFDRAKADGNKVVVSTSKQQVFALDPASPRTLTPAVWNAPAASHRFGPANRFTLERGRRTNTADSQGLFSVTERGTGKARFYIFPQTPPREEAIGPWQIHDGALWYAKTFYAGEGSTGIGGYGRFDTEERKFAVESPPELAKFSASALLVEADVIWLGLLHRGEWGDSAGGLLRIDRATKQVERIEVPDIVNSILRAGARLVLATDAGLAILEGKKLRRYFLETSEEGKPQLSEYSEFASAP